MKICFVNDDFSIGGVQKTVATIGKELSKYYEIEYVAMKSNELQVDIPIDNFHYFDRKSNKIIQYSKEFVKYVQYGLKRSYDYGNYKALEVEYLVEFINNKGIDVVVMNQGTSISLIDKLKCRLDNVKFISWIHSSFEVYVDNYYKRFAQSLLKGLKFSDFVVCLTEEDKKYISEYSENVYQINNPNTMMDSKVSNLNNKKIAFVSRINFYVKGFDYLFEVARNLPIGWKIMIAGSGSQKDKDELYKYILENQLSEKIEYVGELMGEELIEFYYNSDILLSTSRWEGFGLTLLEGLSAGLVIVSFDNRGPSTILSDGEFGYLIPNYDTYQLIRTIHNLAENFIELQKYQKLSLIRAKDFSVDIVVEKWKKILNSLI